MGLGVCAAFPIVFPKLPCFPCEKGLGVGLSVIGTSW
jgi:hypothetical protein